MEQSPNSFSYRPLQGESEIRVLRLLPGTFDDEIQCLLKHVDLDEPLEYIALSYVWGTPEITKSIRLGYNDTKTTEREETSKFPSLFKITINLEAALRHIRHPVHERILWIDAMCIDQNDKKDRSAQVQKMDRIYSLASDVFVWLGRLIEQNEADLGILPCHMQVIWRFLRETSGKLPEEFCRSDNVLLTALEAICCRSWFTRIWVLQEHVLASSTVTIMAGLEEMPLDDFLEAALNVYQTLTRYLPDASSFFITAIRHRFYRQKFRSQQYLGKPIGERALQALMYTSGSLQATDQRDILYGLLGIIGHGPMDYALIPSYDKPLRNFYLDLAHYIITNTQTLAILQCVGGKCQPSWAPCWEWPSTAAFQRFDGMSRYARCQFSENKEELYTSAVPLGKVILYHLVPGNIVGNRGAWCKSMEKLERKLGSMPSVCSRHTDARGIKTSLLNEIIPEYIEGTSLEKSDNEERYEILMGRSIWPGKLLRAGENGEHDKKRFIDLIESTYIAGIGIFVLSNGMIGRLFGEPENDRTFEGDMAYVFPGCRTPLLLTPEENAYRVHWRCRMGGYQDQNEEQHLAVLQKGPFEAIIII